MYGLFSEDIDENVVESHISKLRKRLRHRLGYEPIDSKRYLAYRLVLDIAAEKRPESGTLSSFAQDADALIETSEHFAEEPAG